MTADLTERPITRCPQCGTMFRVSLDQLRAAAGTVRCGACLNTFDALDFLVSSDVLRPIAEPLAKRNSADAISAPATDEIPAAPPQRSPQFSKSAINPAPPFNELPTLAAEKRSEAPATVSSGLSHTPPAAKQISATDTTAPIQTRSGNTESEKTASENGASSRDNPDTTEQHDWLDDFDAEFEAELRVDVHHTGPADRHAGSATPTATDNAGAVTSPGQAAGISNNTPVDKNTSAATDQEGAPDTATKRAEPLDDMDDDELESTILRALHEDAESPLDIGSFEESLEPGSNRHNTANAGVNTAPPQKTTDPSAWRSKHVAAIMSSTAEHTEPVAAAPPASSSRQPNRQDTVVPEQSPAHPAGEAVLTAKPAATVDSHAVAAVTEQASSRDETRAASSTLGDNELEEIELAVSSAYAGFDLTEDATADIVETHGPTSEPEPEPEPEPAANPDAKQRHASASERQDASTRHLLDKAATALPSATTAEDLQHPIAATTAAGETFDEATDTVRVEVHQPDSPALPADKETHAVAASSESEADECAEMMPTAPTPDGTTPEPEQLETPAAATQCHRTKQAPSTTLASEISAAAAQIPHFELHQPESQQTSVEGSTSRPAAAEQASFALSATADRKAESGIAEPAELNDESAHDYAEMEQMLDHHSRTREHYWRWGVLAATILLLVQFVGFNWSNWRVLPQDRASMKRICAVIGCNLPPLRAPEKIEVIDRALVEASSGERRWRFELVAANRADFPQPYPDIELKLTDQAGRLLAENRITPQQYLGRAVTGSMMPPAKPVHIAFNLILDVDGMAGYEIEFL